MSNIDITTLENTHMCEPITRMSIANEYLKEKSLPNYQYEAEPTKEQLIKDYFDMNKVEMFNETNRGNIMMIYVFSEYILLINGFNDSKGIALEMIPLLCDIKTDEELVNNLQLLKVIKDFDNKLSSVDVSSITCPGRRGTINRLRDIYALLLSEECKTMLSAIKDKVADLSEYITTHTDTIDLTGFERSLRMQRERYHSELESLIGFH